MDDSLFSPCNSLPGVLFPVYQWKSTAHNSPWSFVSPRCSGLPQHFSMPTCFCVSHGCCSSSSRDPISDKPLERNVDGHTYKAHTVANRQAAFHAAEENTEAILTAQIEEITTHLSASVLADNVLGPSLVPGGPLWSRNSSEDHQSNDYFLTSSSPLFMAHHSTPSCLSSSQSLPTSSHSSPHQTGPRRFQEAKLITCLSELEQEVNTLCKRALESLAYLGCPSSSGPPTLFPLLKLLQSSRSLRGELQTVTFKGPAVHALKILISVKLQKIDAMRRKIGIKSCLILRQWRHLSMKVPCETGTVFKTNFQSFHQQCFP